MPAAENGPASSLKYMPNKNARHPNAYSISSAKPMERPFDLFFVRLPPVNHMA